MDVVYRYDPFEPMDRRSVDNADQAIESLEHGQNRYVTILRQLQREIMGGPAAQQIVIPANVLSMALPRLTGTAMAQSPFALVLGCSDARVPIEQIFDRSANDLFVIRVAGNVLGVECLGSIDYAVNTLNASLKLIVVLGHTLCGAVTAAVDSYLAPKNYAEIGFTHALRSLLDRVSIAIRGAAPLALERGGKPGLAAERLSRGASGNFGILERGDHGL